MIIGYFVNCAAGCSLFCGRSSHADPHDCLNCLFRELMMQIESRETMLQRDDLYDSDTLLDLQQSKHTIQVLVICNMVIQGQSYGSNRLQLGVVT